MEYKSNFIAEYIIQYCNNKGISIPNLKLQKLLYLIQHRLLNSSLNFIEDDFIVLPYGHVIKEIYDKYSVFGAMSIYLYMIMEKKFKFYDEDKVLIDNVLEKYSNYDVLDLVELSHKKGNSWDKIKNKSGIGNIIPKELIREDVI